MLRIIAITGLVASLSVTTAHAQDRPTLEIAWPPAGSVVTLGDDPEGAIGVVVRSNFALRPAGSCRDNRQCGHVHMKIDPEGDSCNLPGRPYNSMNSDFGGTLIKARFGHCAVAGGNHVIGVLLADNHHRPILVGGKPVTATVSVRTIAPGGARGR